MIAFANEDNEEAERLLRVVRAGFVEAGIGYDVAMVSLDLGTLLLSEGSVREVKAIASEAFTLFASQLVSREALAAFKIFVDAAARQRLSEAIIKETIQAMRRAPRHPLDLARPS